MGGEVNKAVPLKVSCKENQQNQEDGEYSTETCTFQRDEGKTEIATTSSSKPVDDNKRNDQITVKYDWERVKEFGLKDDGDKMAAWSTIYWQVMRAQLTLMD